MFGIPIQIQKMISYYGNSRTYVREVSGARVQRDISYAFTMLGRVPHLSHCHSSLTPVVCNSCIWRIILLDCNMEIFSRIKSEEL
jgi:hypothetical protein